MSKPGSSSACGAALIAALFATSAAQAANHPEAVDVLATTPTPSAKDPVSPLTALSVEGSQDDSTATLKFGFSSNAIRRNSGGGAYGEFWTSSLALSAPLDDKGGPTHLATLDGLTNATSVSLQVARLVVPAAGTVGPDGTEVGPPCKAMWAAYPAYLRAHPNAKIAQCDAANILDVTGDEDLAQRWYKAQAEAVAARGPIWQYALTGKVGRQSYTSYDPATLAKTDRDRTPWQVGVSVAVISGAGDWAVTGQYQHEESYQEADSQTACLVGQGPVLSCVTGALAPAQGVSKDVLALEARWTPARLDMNYGKARFGLAPKASYDARNGDWALSLPIYLFGSDNGLTGGVRADWTSKTHEVAAGVFITKTFDIANVF